ncbi:10805_t:CDS:2 [Ambispora gerdemannii]|uniref:10805_t:CDS:1 n=1 Tax=Ambispora gerdemannii TaxID=144530 RepID=A0A9N9GTW4_9GLOM|nr:10805_t:CDS:2 [Ambispora gerdemannii]
MAPKDGKSRKPANTAFKQQRLKAWQPILTPKTVLPTFFIVGMIFAPLGGLLLYASDSVSEISIDYTYCQEQAPSSQNFDNAIPLPDDSVEISFSQSNSTIEKAKWITYKMNMTLPEGATLEVSKCEIEFTIPAQLKPGVFLYYRLTNFFQNHRRYVKSFMANQLKGDAVGVAGLQNCKPLATDSNGTIIYPCGLIANSMFNDTIHDPVLLNPAGKSDGNETYVFSNKSIAWPSDKQKYGPTKYDVNSIVPPPNWAARYVDGRYNETTIPDLHSDEHFQVWMRTAGLPNFRKLYGKNETHVMAQGRYRIVIDDFFPVLKYGGTKSIVISTVSFLGGKNPFLGIAYIAVGIVCVVLGCLFTARHLYKPRKLGDHTYLSWNQNTPAGGAAGAHRD